VIFQSSKLAQYQSEARKLAMKDAKLKAEDYVSVFLKVGKAMTISDNSHLSTTARLCRMRPWQWTSAATTRETAEVKITITANVSVSFILE
jgi:uncharacterized protein YggE